MSSVALQMAVRRARAKPAPTNGNGDIEVVPPHAYARQTAEADELRRMVAALQAQVRLLRNRHEKARERVDRLEARLDTSLRPPADDTFRLTVRIIVKVVARYYGFTVHEITSNRRFARLTRPRHVAYYFARLMTPSTYPEIAWHLGKMDHTTIMYGVAKIEAALLVDNQLAGQVATIKKKLTGKV